MTKTINDIVKAIKKAKNKNRADGAVIVIDTPELNKRFDSLLVAISTHQEQESKARKAFEERMESQFEDMAKAANALSAAAKLLPDVKKSADSVAIAAADVNRAMTVKPKWYEPTSYEFIAKIVSMIVGKAPEPNLTSEQMEAKLNARDKKMWKNIKELVAKVAVERTRTVAAGPSNADIIALIAANAAGGVGIEVDDLSAQCNGSNKVFTLTQAYATGKIHVVGQQAPGVYAPGSDFTESGATQITLGAGVGAPKAGQRLVAIYEKNS